MAAYCKQCSLEVFGEDFKDLSLGIEAKEYPNILAYIQLVICEGCGDTIVNESGECINRECLKAHGK